MSDISKWFGKAIYITALDNFEEINKDIVPLINSEVVPTNSQYARTTDIKPNELQSIDDNIHHDERFKNLFDAIHLKTSLTGIFMGITSFNIKTLLFVISYNKFFSSFL